jgi:hypothetical protein
LAADPTQMKFMLQGKRGSEIVHPSVAANCADHQLSMINLPNSGNIGADGLSQSRQRLGLACLIYFHTIICCLSLLYLVPFYKGAGILFDETRLYAAVVSVAAFAVVSIPFAFARFSFGYFIGFYFYTMILGFLWLNCFSKFNYNHTTAAFSAAASAIAFFLPALLITSPIKQTYVISARALDRLLTFILALAAGTIVLGAIYNFRIVAIGDIYRFREELQFPTALNYLIGITSNALLPFAFACFAARRNIWRAGAALLLLLLFYPITLTKLTLFAPFWLLAIAQLSKILEARATVVLSLLLPVLVGVVLFIFLPEPGAFPFETYYRTLAYQYISVVNFRMIAVPSSALDFYNDFFSTHDLTYFCQISFLKPLVSCPYRDQLAIVLSEYGRGNFNASLFATEGLASVGPLFAPVAVFACGLVIALGNRLSAGLPPRFILMSGAILTQAFLNVPLTTILLTHGAGILFLLWYLTPRTMFETESQ